MERKYRHVLDTTRALKMQSHVPIQLWSECILIATYLINKMPMEQFNWTTPYERLYETLPHYSHLRKFGCLCFAITMGTHKDKFQERAIKPVLVGYASTHKAYKLYNLTDRSIFISRDVVFYEDIFPFQNNNDIKNFVLSIPIVGTEYTDSQSHTSSPANDNPHESSFSRRSQRHRQPPIWMQDYANLLHTSSLSIYPSYNSYVCNVNT